MNFLSVLILFGQTCGVRIHHGTIKNNTSWFMEPLHDNPVLFFDMRFVVEFPKEACCPILDIYYTPKEYEELECFTDLAKNERIWYGNNLFFLEYLEGSLVECKTLSDNSTNRCTGTFKLQDYEPKMRWFIFGYLCSEKGKSLQHLTYKLTLLQESNVTTCEAIDSSVEATRKCAKLYDYVTFPNLFGDNNQIEAARTMDMFYARLDNQVPPCHRDMEKILCRVFFPECPVEDMKPDGELTTTYLPHACEELCYDLVHIACAKEFGSSFSAGASCNYFPDFNKSDICIYEPVTCERPPDVSHGTYTPEMDVYPVTTVIVFSCFEDFELRGPRNASCQYSGLWTEYPSCILPHTSPNLLTIYMGGLGSLSLVIILIILAIVIKYCLKRKRLRSVQKHHYNNEGYVSFQKRNKKYDAFISYNSEESEGKYVRQQLQPKLEVDHSPPFKLLIHERDFRADTLIYVNIVNAVKDSNSAIILLSQAYIDSRWCREEFEECMEENANDPSYRLFVILMEPLEQLQRPSAYMTKYLRSKTFLQRSDPQLFKKLTEYLLEVRSELKVETVTSDKLSS